MMLASVAVIGGLLVLIWGADLFVEGSSVTARRARLSRRGILVCRLCLSAW